MLPIASQPEAWTLADVHVGLGLMGLRHAAPEQFAKVASGIHAQLSNMIFYFAEDAERVVLVTVKQAKKPRSGTGFVVHLRASWATQQGLKLAEPQGGAYRYVPLSCLADLYKIVTWHSLAWEGPPCPTPGCGGTLVQGYCSRRSGSREKGICHGPNPYRQGFSPVARYPLESFGVIEWFSVEALRATYKIYRQAWKGSGDFNKLVMAECGSPMLFDEAISPDRLVCAASRVYMKSVASIGHDVGDILLGLD